MSISVTSDRIRALIADILAAARETTIVEFKRGNSDRAMIGKLISALSNAAALEGEREAYVIWGVDDETRLPVGTTFDPDAQPGSGPPLAFWLSQELEPAPDFQFEVLDYEGLRLVLLTIPATTNRPVEFKHIPYVRIGPATPRLSEHPQKQATLWSRLQTYIWETQVALGFATLDQVVDLLDSASYLRLTGQPEAMSETHAVESMVNDGLIRPDVGGRYDILNLGAILFANSLAAFGPTLLRTGLRFVKYAGQGRDAITSQRRDGDRGYAIGLANFLEFLDRLLPENEYISGAFREKQRLFPSLAIRELVANALMHQDMTVTGAGPLVELFEDRLEISNPGQALVPPRRFLDAQPRSRNDRLAGLMRRMKMCEQQGTGIDIVITQAEFYQLPPPDFRQEISGVRTVLFAPRTFAEMSPDERVRACYQHAGLRYVNGQRMTNTTLRQRFGLDNSASATSQVSKVIKAARDDGLIKADEVGGSAHRYMPADWDAS